MASAQEELYNSFLPYLLTIARRYGIRASEEVDMVQEIFIEVFTNLDKYDSSKGTLTTWIRTLAVYKILNHKRKIGNLKMVMDIDKTIDYDPNLMDYQRHKPEYILKAIEQLSEGYKMVFNLYEVDGYNHAEIAKMLNITEAGSRSQLSRARSVLRRHLNNLNDYGQAR